MQNRGSNGHFLSEISRFLERLSADQAACCHLFKKRGLRQPFAILYVENAQI